MTSLDPNLHIIAGDTQQIARNLNRLQDQEENISAVRNEFIGKPEVCHTLASHIVRLRRKPKDTEQRELFMHLLDNYVDVLLEHYDIRWLLSICDTLVDIGDPITSATAMNIVQCINRCNIDSTILVNVVDGRLNENRLAQEIKVPTWGGMITADIPSGDMIYNMMNRLDSVVSKHDLLWKIWCEIKNRSRQDQNIVLNHLCSASRIRYQRSFFP
tara:strand:+ start:4634 stop:5278 length:645 start_codon:yes stop_codon:yes gene_type:complete